MLKRNFLCFSLCPLLFTLSLCTTGRSLTLSSLRPHLFTFIRSPSSLLFSRVNSHNSFSLVLVLLQIYFSSEAKLTSIFSRKTYLLKKHRFSSDENIFTKIHNSTQIVLITLTFIFLKVRRSHFRIHRIKRHSISNKI